MTVLTWDDVGQRVYETGVDRGVLYLSNGTAIPWNGLTSITENPNRKSTSVYYDGIKINELVAIGGFSATMKAFTYPDEFLELEGFGQGRTGFFYDDQPTQGFDLCYRTRVGTDLDEDAGYKIHILYNVIATPKDREFATISDDPDFVEFEWDLFAIPEEVSGMRPTAHYILDSYSSCAS